MPSSPATVKQAELRRAIRGAMAAGLTVARVDIDVRAGVVRIFGPDATDTGHPDTSAEAQLDAWLRVHGDG